MEPNSPPRFCRELQRDSETFLQEAQVPDFKIFWKWTLDRYKGIKTASSLKNYWRVLRMHILDMADRDFDPREKKDVHNTLVIDEEDDDPIFSLLDHLISLAVDDDAFEAESAKDVQNMFWVKIPPGKKSLTLKWKRRVLDRPVFREPLQDVGKAGSSPTEPLRASTWIRYLKRLGEKAGFQHAFTQYGLRRGFLNVVNHKAPASVRDQIFDHKPGTVSWYFNEEVQFDTEACYLGRPSNDVVQKVARLASLTADASAPTELSSEQRAKLSQHPTVIRSGDVFPEPLPQTYGTYGV